MSWKVVTLTLSECSINVYVSRLTRYMNVVVKRFIMGNKKKQAIINRGVITCKPSFAQKRKKNIEHHPHLCTLTENNKTYVFHNVLN